VAAKSAAVINREYMLEDTTSAVRQSSSEKATNERNGMLRGRERHSLGASLAAAAACGSRVGLCDIGISLGFKMSNDGGVRVFVTLTLVRGDNLPVMDVGGTSGITLHRTSYIESET